MAGKVVRAFQDGACTGRKRRWVVEMATWFSLETWKTVSSSGLACEFHTLGNASIRSSRNVEEKL